jgi:putative radical SAM enzyme (TIGR03279 family)
VNQPRRRTAKGGEIVAVAEGSRSHILGIKPGDRLLSINRQPLRDVLDYRFLAAEEELLLELEREGKSLQLTMTKEWAEDPGIEFSSFTFDGIRRCNNRCFFCYVDGLPPEARPSLRIKDDDYRHSFLFGNFITLTNLRREDWWRLAEQRLSPLYVSIHTTDPELRRQMLGNPRAPDIREQLRRLERLRIRVHGQVVLCPGANDGETLARTVADLAALYPTVQSLAVVPVGITRYHPGKLPQVDRRLAQAVVERAGSWQREHRRRLGVSFVYLADELYFLAGAELPSARSYDGFPQYQNGVGMTRMLLEEWERVKRGRKLTRQRRWDRGLRLTLVCGALISPILSPIISELNALGELSLRLVPVENRFFGSTVTVSGLLAGRDVIQALRGKI